MRHRRKRSSFGRFHRRRLYTVMGLVLLALLMLRAYRSRAPVDSFSFDPSSRYFVERVIDGDTLLLTGGHRVRLLGVDTPETVAPHRPVEPFGPEASAFTRKHVEARWVTLHFDRERRDRYHRILAYTFVGDWFLNEELIRAGYSRAEVRFPYSPEMKDRFRAAEAEARAAQRGIWSLDNAP